MLSENDAKNWDQYLNQVLTSYLVTPHVASGETPFFHVYRRDPNLSWHQLIETTQYFLDDSDSRCLKLEMHLLALAIAEKMLCLGTKGKIGLKYV